MEIILPAKILLAADGSEDSRLAIRMATGLAVETGAELHVVYVVLISPWILGASLSDGEYRRIRQEEQGWLDEMVDQIQTLGGEVAEAHFRVGRKADDEIIRLSEELGADLVVVGSKGKSTFERALMGSDAESIVRHCRYPVLVVRGR